jgi:hypothetical protein
MPVPEPLVWAFRSGKNSKAKRSHRIAGDNTAEDLVGNPHGNQKTSSAFEVEC